jgi:hypothetical protein
MAVGNYVSDIGRQHSLAIPNGVLHPQANNSIVIAVWKLDQSEGRGKNSNKLAAL